MPGDGIADDAEAYADLPEVGEASQRAKGAGIASDADLFADMLDEDTGKARSLDTNWLYEEHGQVFGPVKSKELLELLYRGEVDEKTMIAVEEGEFQPLKRIGVFRAHLPKVQAHLAEVRSAEAAAKEAAKKRLVRRTLLIVSTTAVVGAAAVGIPWYVISAQKAQAEADGKAQEDELRKELNSLLASVSIEPPLLELVEDEPTKRKKGKRRKKRRRGRMSFSGGKATTGELSRAEVMQGVATVFGGIKRCIVQQIQRDPESVTEQIVLRFSVNNAGKAQNVSLRDRFLRRSALNGCMAGQLAKVGWRAYKGEVRNIDYPISIGR